MQPPVLTEFSFGIPELQIHDKAIPSSLLRPFWDYSQNKAQWEFKNRGNPRDPLTSWVSDIVNYSKDLEENELEAKWSDLKNTMPFLAEVWQHLQDLVQKQHRIKRVFLNGHTFGLGDGIHQDGDNIRTFLVYLNPEWLPAWQGETMYYNENQSEVMAAILPHAGRLIYFDGRIPHAGRAPSRLFAGMRVSLAFHTSLM